MHTDFNANDLRPEFTAILAKSLIAGQSINLISPHGQGRRRTLQDLRLHLPIATQVFHMNIRSYKLDYKKLLHDIYSKVANFTTADKSLNILLDQIEQQHQQSLFILHNFDELRHPNSTQSGYNAHFFHMLNSINKRNNLALLCVTEKLHDHYLLQADGSVLAGSHLEAISLALPCITYAQIFSQLSHQKPQKDPPNLHALTLSLLNHDSPYTALEAYQSNDRD